MFENIPAVIVCDHWSVTDGSCLYWSPIPGHHYPVISGGGGDIADSSGGGCGTLCRIKMSEYVGILIDGTRRHVLTPTRVTDT